MNWKYLIVVFALHAGLAAAAESTAFSEHGAFPDNFGPRERTEYEVLPLPLTPAPAPEEPTLRAERPACPSRGRGERVPSPQCGIGGYREPNTGRYECAVKKGFDGDCEDSCRFSGCRTP